MSESGADALSIALERIRLLARQEKIRVTQHAQQEMIEEEITLDQVLEATSTAQILEYYPEHQRGACCLIYGQTNRKRDLHIVCTTAQPVLILITVYEPKLPKWVTPTQRRKKE